MRTKIVIGTLVFSLMLSVGCTLPLTPELIAALAKDNASFCAVAGVKGGAGAIVGAATGGYGQVDLSFCRSNRENATVKLSPDGTISIEHGPSDVAVSND